MGGMNLCRHSGAALQRLTKQFRSRCARQAGRRTTVQKTATASPRTPQLYQVVTASDQLGIALHSNDCIPGVNQEMDRFS